MVMEGGGCGESVMRPRGALCGCCGNTLLWDVETVTLTYRSFLFTNWCIS